MPAHLHANNPIDEEEEKDEQRNVWQRLETLYEGPEESADTLSFGQQLDQTHHTEQTEEVDGEEIRARLWSREREVRGRNSHVDDELMCNLYLPGWTMAVDLRENQNSEMVTTANRG